MVNRHNNLVQKNRKLLSGAGQQTSNSNNNTLTHSHQQQANIISQLNSQALVATNAVNMSATD